MHPERERQRQIHKGRRRRNYRREFIRAEKLRRGCIDCGYNENADALEWDHVDPATKVAPMGRMSGSWISLHAEMAKCVVRCANCHAIRSAEQARERMGIKRAELDKELDELLEVVDEKKRELDPSPSTGDPQALVAENRLP